ncbi:transposase [Streptomyces sp. NPDC000878]
MQHRRRDVELTEQIKEIHAESGGIYGSPRVHAVKREDVHVGRKRVERLMHDVRGWLRGPRWTTIDGTPSLCPYAPSSTCTSALASPRCGAALALSWPAECHLGGLRPPEVDQLDTAASAATAG